MNKKVELPSWDSMAKYWKSEILSDPHFVRRDAPNPREICGVVLDPAIFIPMYMKRFLTRMEMEGKLPVPGTYSVEFKVFH